MVDTVSVAVNGNGTYPTPSGYLPTAAGTYEWVASYSGDANNNPTATTKGSEPETVKPASGTMSTTAGGTVVVGAGNLTDSATLSGAYNPTGTITFTLYAPNGTTVVDVLTDTVNGNGTYNTPTGYLPTATGTYQWVVSYSGDSNNNSASSTKGSEPETVISASPTLGTIPDVAVVIGSGGTLTDSATVLDGYNPTGTITFTLYAPNDTTVVGTEMVAVSGNGTYNTPTGYLPSAGLGTYQWVASYSGDSNNNPVVENIGNEPEAVDPASPTLTASAGGTVVLGSGNNLTDSVTLSEGDNPTGTITFTLFAPGGVSVVDTETITVSGNGAYSTPNGYLPTAAGSYQWIASYGGDSDNNPASAVTGSSSLLSINGASGANPRAGFVVDTAGNLYGTTSAGGASGDGTIYELAAGSSTITTLASFDGTNGTIPFDGLIIDSAGNLYGTTSLGGKNNDGTIFELPKGSGTIVTLASFNSDNGGSQKAAWSWTAPAIFTARPPWGVPVTMARFSSWPKEAARLPPWPTSTAQGEHTPMPAWSWTVRAIFTGRPVRAVPTASAPFSSCPREAARSPFSPPSVAEMAPTPLPA